MEKSCPTRQESVTRLLELPWASQLFIHFFQNEAFCYVENKKLALLEAVGSGEGDNFFS